MFENDAANAGFIQTYDVSKQLKNKTFESQQVIFEGLFEDFEVASQSIISGINGTAGVVVSSDGTKAYLMNGNGLEYTQIIEKGLMGACLYYQSATVYLGNDKMNVDNTMVTAGEGTTMQHHWDEAFGYFGVPIDFPTNSDGLAFWGKYCNDRNAILGTNIPIMNNFLKGRAAIANNDLTARDEAIIEIQKNWELISVGTAIHYLNAAVSNFNDDALRNHALSEAAAFIYSLQFNPNKKVTNANVNDLLTLIGGDSAFSNMNFYTVTEANLEAAKNQLATYYNLEDKKDNL
jgi:DNA-binding beta-propeller fold protein YncE